MLLVAAYTLDRGGDVIQRGAFRDTIAAWRATPKKQLPWPGTMRPTSLSD